MSDEIRIFISYAREDQPRVQELYDLLVDAGYHPWLDREHLHPGQRWESIIKSALNKSHFVLVCLSATSINKRGFLQKEIKQALEQAQEKLEDDVWLIPARLDDCDVPDALADIQWVDLFDHDGLQQLLAAMEYQLKKERIPPPSALPAQAKIKSEPATPLPIEPQEQMQEKFQAPPAKLTEPKREIPKPKLPPPQLTESKLTVVPPLQIPLLRVLSTKVRVGIASVILATGAWLGYGVWRDSNRGDPPDNKPSPPIQQTNDLTIDLANGVKIEMVKLDGGEFTMGGDQYDNEKPRHQVRISPFAIARYEVTQAQWIAVMDGNNPSSNKGDSLPVENVSWDDVQRFLKKAGNGFRLPTEAEWEYAARANSTTAYNFGDSESQLGEYAWFYSNSGNKTHPVGEKKPNQFGLYDMHGNVWEWCSDWYSGDYYQTCKSQGVITDPQGPNAGVDRVVRGGSWHYGAVVCRSASRVGLAPGGRDGNLGFRLVRIGR